MPVRIVQSKQNARLKELRRALTQPGRAEGGRAGIEGPKLIEEALRSGLAVPCVFVAQESQRLLEQLALPPEIEVLLLPRELLLAELTTETPQPVAALIERPDWTWAHLLGSPHKRAPLVVVLAGIQDPGNLGTIIRSVEAFGATGILSLPGTVNEWNPKAVRASAGSVFRVPVLAANATDSVDRLREAGLRIVATTAGAAEPAELVDMAGPVALLIGNEGNGVPRPLSTMADCAVTIPCPGPVESLNVAIATSVLLYEAARQRSLRTGGPSDRRGNRR